MNCTAVHYSIVWCSRVQCSTKPYLLKIFHLFIYLFIYYYLLTQSLISPAIHHANFPNYLLSTLFISGRVGRAETSGLAISLVAAEDVLEKVWTLPFIRCIHTRTLIHTHTHTHTHTLGHTRTHIHIHTHTHTPYWQPHPFFLSNLCHFSLLISSIPSPLLYSPLPSSTYFSKVWFHTCKSKDCKNRNDTSKGGCCVWLDESELLHAGDGFDWVNYTKALCSVKWYFSLLKSDI